MKKIKSKLIYDTAVATQLAMVVFGEPGFSNWFTEALYETSKKNYFLDVSGGPDSPHATVGPGFNTSGADIIPLTEDEAIQWVADNKEGEIETLFPGVVTDA